MPLPQSKPKSPPPTNPPQSSPNNSKSNSGPGRPKNPINPAKAFKTASTGETRNSPYTNPNIIFWLGMGLIIASGWSSGRIPFIFKNAWNSGTAQANSKDWWTQIKVVLGQLIFLFILTVTARAIPPLARIWLVTIIGLWILWLMKNPQALLILNGFVNPPGSATVPKTTASTNQSTINILAQGIQLQ